MTAAGDRDIGAPRSALTWVPLEVAREMTWASGVESRAEALAVVALATGVDSAWVPGEEPWAAEAVERMRDEGVEPVWATPGVFSRLTDAVGWLEALRLSASDPARLAGAIDRALHDTLVSARAAAESGCTILAVADDLAGAAGYLVAPDFALDSLLPAYRAILCEWEPHGQAIFHSDGDIRALLPALRHAGFDALHLASIPVPLLEAYLDAVSAAGLRSFGGLAAAELSAEAVPELTLRAERLLNRGDVVVADDGGITSMAQVGALSRIYARLAEVID